ncbi:hypothetical protein BDR06DRAFT_968724 [Suillus hirtellus]|nr:hypothetical protein BDR06DRAFT_968724 [Suillus hirtellus]
MNTILSMPQLVTYATTCVFMPYPKLFHSSLSAIVASLKPIMIQYEVIMRNNLCYPVWSNIGAQNILEFDEYGLIGDLVLIKGAFKDHLINWVAKYLKAMHGTK